MTHRPFFARRGPKAESSLLGREPQYARVKLWRVQETDKARLFRVMPEDGAREVWIARSVVKHLSTLPAEPNGLVPCLVDMEAWVVEKEDL